MNDNNSEKTAAIADQAVMIYTMYGWLVFCISVVKSDSPNFLQKLNSYPKFVGCEHIPCQC